MANTENIEAKLCAYIDGDLDAQGRAEIEKHLAANPQHRTLIEQLSKQRDLLRELPRENAPEEILDALQSQMERSVLLGDDDAAQESAAMKIHRWPQLMAAAAIVVLTVGLGLVIYFVLPRTGGDTNYAVMSKPGASLDDAAAEAGTESGRIALGEPTAGDMPSSASPSKMAAAAAAAATPSASADATERAALSKSADGRAEVADAAGQDALQKDKAADVFAPAAPMVGTGAGELAIAPGDLAGLQRQLQNADLAKQLKSTAGIQDNPMFVIVSTADPSAARSEVTNYLATNKIAWDSVSHPTPELQVAQDQAVNLSRSQSVNVRMKNGDVQQQQQQLGQTQTQTTQAPQQEWSGLGETQQKKFEGKSAAGAAGTAESASRSNTGAGAGSAQAGVGAQPTQSPAVEERVQQRLESAAQAPAAGAGAQPGLADSKQRMSPPRPDEVTSNVVQPNEGLLQATTQAPLKPQVQDQKQMSVAAQPATEGRLIIARGMTEQQAVELQTNLSKQTTVQRAAVYKQQRPLAMKRDREVSPFGGGGGAPATGPAPTTEPLPTYKELDAKLLAGAPATTLPATPADAGGWRDADAPVASRQAANAEGAPTTQDALSGAIATTGPTTLPLGANDALSLAVPTTAPAGGVADERLDVVILVEDDAQLPAAPDVMEELAAPNTAPNAAPTTEPSAAPTTQPAPDVTPAP